MKKLHMICNAHVDPVWQWEWEEGVSAGVATFNSAAKLLDEYDFIFCHNEAILYAWAKEYDPKLFERIKELVRAGKWHIMSGWYLQPDCTIPSGESIVRQIMVGRKFFQENFDYKPNDTAINFDSFGHSAGLPQILKKCGYKNYIFCRPNRTHAPQYKEEYIWEGVDGSKIRCYHSSKIYCSGMGYAAQDIKNYIEQHSDMQTALVLWGVGNHGGGPSRKDLADIEELKKSCGVELVHSTPEKYFSEKKDIGEVVKNSIGPFAPGCYTSMVPVKQAHYKVENLLYSVEKMAAVADMLGLVKYDFEGFEFAEKKMLLSEFHDILPGSGIKDVETYALGMLGAAEDRLREIRAKIIFAFAYTQKAAQPDTYPNFVYNPHPYEVNELNEFEFMLSNGYYLNMRYTDFDVYMDGKKVKSQVVKERSQLNMEWRKRVVVECPLKPSSLARFDFVENVKTERPSHGKVGEKYIFEGNGTKITLDCTTGRITSIVKDGKEYLKESIRFEIWQDKPCAWGISPEQNRILATKLDEFRLMTVEEAEDYCKDKTLPVQIVEDGDILTVIEALFKYKSSVIRAKYKFIKATGELIIEPTVLCQEFNSMVKLTFPTSLNEKYIGQVMFGEEELPQNSGERSSQKWVKMCGDGRAFAVINKGTYGSCAENGTINISLLRTAVYCCHYNEFAPYTTPDRTYDHMEQGERRFSFSVLCGQEEAVSRGLDRKAKAKAESPYCINIFPQNEEKTADISSVVFLSDESVDVPAMKKSRDGGYIIRLFNPLNRKVKTKLSIPMYSVEEDVVLERFEVKTFRFDKGLITECDQMYI